MTTLTIKHIHTPNKGAISTVNDTQYTFCESCEENIDRIWLEFDGDRLDMWSDWGITK
jgi:RNA polymerase-binding transcription factor DksA